MSISEGHVLGSPSTWGETDVTSADMTKENSAIRSGVADLLQDNPQHADHTQL